MSFGRPERGRGIFNMSDSNNGGPAFPSVGEGFGNPLYSAPGMTLRDYFASQADIPWQKAIEVLMQQTGRKEFSIREVLKARSGLKYYEAEAMLTERERSK